MSSNTYRDIDDSSFEGQIAAMITVTCELVTSDEDGDEIEFSASAGGHDLFERQLYVSQDSDDMAEDVADIVRDVGEIDDETLIRAFSFEYAPLHDSDDGSYDETHDDDDDTSFDEREDEDDEEAFEEGRAHLENIVADAVGRKVAEWAAAQDA